VSELRSAHRSTRAPFLRKQAQKNKCSFGIPGASGTLSPGQSQTCNASGSLPGFIRPCAAQGVIGTHFRSAGKWAASAGLPGIFSLGWLVGRMDILVRLTPDAHDGQECPSYEVSIHGLVYGSARMEDMFSRGWDQLIARDSGPLHIGLILQPLVVYDRSEPGRMARCP
jgi:hypothetical protein